MLLIALFVGCGGETCPADPWPEADLDVVGDPSQAALVDDTTVSGWSFRYHKNPTYGCADGGSHSFLIASPEGVDDSAPRDLVIYFHGGGAGGFTCGGAFDGAGDNMDEEDPDELLGHFALLEGQGESAGGVADWPPTQGLPARLVARDPAPRFLFVSMCDQDVYSGVGLPDADNPLGGEVDGLLAADAAIAWAREALESDHVFAYGCSAGSVGATTWLGLMGRRGEHLSGGIVDAGANGPRLQEMYELPGDDCFRSQVPDVEGVLYPRVGPWLYPENYPSELIARGEMRTPLYATWSRGDRRCCGEDHCSAHYASAIGDALAAHAPAVGQSVARETCVGEGCDVHCPTLWELDDAETGEPAGADALRWIEQRLAEPPPEGW